MLSPPPQYDCPPQPFPSFSSPRSPISFPHPIFLSCILPISLPRPISFSSPCPPSLAFPTLPSLPFPVHSLHLFLFSFFHSCHTASMLPNSTPHASLVSCFNPTPLPPSLHPLATISFAPSTRARRRCLPFQNDVRHESLELTG